MPTDQQPTETARPRRLLTIHQQLLFALLSVNVVAAVKGVGGERLLIPIISDYASRF